jgi:hypothetical protein
MTGQNAKACVKPIHGHPVSTKALDWQWQENNSSTINCKYIMHD